jgi:2-polyprenyl-3-methyl-5-hydroxy-6-metoxy-1,4-benzoquinol methylase
MPQQDERAAWNRRYQAGSHGSLKPDPFLVQAYEHFVSPLFPRPGSALDLAAGVGRHSIWLAERGWRVTMIDISEIAVEKAKKNAGALAKNIDFEAADASQFLSTPKFDLILVFFYLERQILPAIANALRPGGLLIYKTYTFRQKDFEGGPSHPMHLLRENELLHAFPDLTVLHHHESIRERGLAAYVGRKTDRTVAGSHE